MLVELKQTEAALPIRASKLSTDTGEFRMLRGMERGQTGKLFEKIKGKGFKRQETENWNATAT